MNPISGNLSRPRKRKQLNIGAIKAMIVAVSGFFTAGLSALTGLGAHVTFAPMLSWMLGFNVEKAQATALAFATLVSTTVVVEGIVANSHVLRLLIPGGILCFAATVGAMLVSPLAKRSNLVANRRVFQSLGIVVTLFVIIQTSRVNAWSPSHSNFASWHQSWQLLLLGIVVGGLTQVGGFPSGVLLIPALYYFAAFTAKDALLTSLIVVALASALPAWSYSQKGLVDMRYGTWALIGGGAGGVVGGMLLEARYVSSSVVLYLFGVVGMFLCARELARLAGVAGSASVNR